MCLDQQSKRPNSKDFSKSKRLLKNKDEIVNVLSFANHINLCHANYSSLAWKYENSLGQYTNAVCLSFKEALFTKTDSGPDLPQEL